MSATALGLLPKDFAFARQDQIVFRAQEDQVVNDRRLSLQGSQFDGEVLGLAARLKKEAAELQRRFEERFWCEDIGFYAYALDGDKKPVKTSPQMRATSSGAASPARIGPSA
jgi:hypothetical protein